MSPQDQARAFAQLACDVLKDALKPDHDILAREVQPLYEEIERSDRELAIYMERAEAAERRVKELEVATAFDRARQTVAPLVKAELKTEEITAEVMEFRVDTPKGMSQDETFRWLVERSNLLDAAQARCRELEAERDAERNLAELTRRDHHRLVCDACDEMAARLSEAQAKLQEYEAGESDDPLAVAIVQLEAECARADAAEAKLRELEDHVANKVLCTSAEVTAWEAERALADRLGKQVELGKEACADCDGNGFYATPVHVCGGRSEEECRSRCPEAEQTQCERCARADEALAALREARAK